MAFLLLLGLNACASRGDQHSVTQPTDQQLLMRSMQDLSAHQTENVDRIDQLDQRVGELERQTRQQQAQIEAISQALEALQNRHPIHTGKVRKSSPSTEKLVEKINQVEASLRQTAPATNADHAEEEKNVYTAAYLAWKSNRYDEASAQFAQFLEKYPHGEYSDQAWYWLGESLYAQHEGNKAFKAYEHVIRHFPDSVKYAASLLRMGQIYQDKKRPRDARVVLERLIREHGDTPSAAEARKLLANMEAAGKEK